MKFKVRDKVRFIGNYNKHCNRDGRTGLTLKELIKSTNNILTVSEVHYTYITVKEDVFWCFDNNELELIKDKQFTKSDLKDGDIVTYRNGDKRTIINNNLIDEQGEKAHDLNYYREDLTSKGGTGYLDIIKVERPTSYETVFERKEEILDETEKRYLREVIRPFRKQVIEIIKWKYTGRNEYFIKIRLENGGILKFPDFTDKTMYKGMLADNSYTLEQLGL